MRNTHKPLVRKYERDQLENLGVDGKIINEMDRSEIVCEAVD
jgi:hypothetical protein